MGTRIYVGNLSFNTTEDQLRALVETNGVEVSSVQVVTDRDTGRPRGFAFVELVDAGKLQDVISRLNGTSVDGRTLTVNEARERAGGGARGTSREGFGGRDRRY